MLLLLTALGCRNKDYVVDSAPLVTEDTGPFDDDGDGFVASVDCDDANPAVYPGAVELCNGLDDDGVEDIDEEAVDASTWYADTDTDGYGAGDAISSCEQPDGTSAVDGDCDDADTAYHPGAEESDCTDPNDYNCDGAVGYADNDADGFPACEDCDDFDDDVNPDAEEVCNGEDDDCDGSIDVGASDADTWYADTDADGYGDATMTSEACDQPSGYVADATDCDDSSAETNPAGTEICNDIDDDCDDDIDEEATDAPTWYADTDADGYGDAASSTDSCDAPTGSVSDDTDCDDADGDVNPGATEICNDIDDDCDGDIDGGATDATTWYEDADCDGYGDAASSTDACDSPGDDYTTDDTDCDDSDPLAFPSGTEVCTSVDNDCDGTVDNDCTDTNVISSPTHDAIDSPTGAQACALIGEMDTSPGDAHYTTNLSSFMSVLTGSSSGLASSTDQAVYELDWSNRCSTAYTASDGNYTTTTNSWPVLSSTGSYGAARFRGYMNIGCGEELHRTMGLLGNDALSFSIEGTEIIKVNWSDGQWKKFRYVTFPEPGLYAFEVQWSTNLNCNIDPFEIVWAEGFVSGYEDYDTMCSYSSCTYGTGTPIPSFSIVTDDNLVATTDGTASDCAQCESDTGCDSGESCNDAGICE